MKLLGQALLLGSMVSCGACQKVPITQVNAGFLIADATWFEEEQTLFIFYRLFAEQGLGPESQLEVTWRTDDAEQPWTAVRDLTPVHTHLPAACGPYSLCGSTSLKVEKVPREVGLQLRYHRDSFGFDAGPGVNLGTLVLTAPLTLNLIAAGPLPNSRSLWVYGVFEETNNTVQWRARHQFPTLRNDEVKDLGLRRWFRIADVQYGDVAAPPGSDYGYGFAASCPAGLTPLPWGPLETINRAIFDTNRLPLAASTALGVCAEATVTDAKGTFTAPAIARKNPEVHPAFPLLRSPIRENVEVGFLLRPCARVISEVHQSMQVQRLMLAGAPEVCLDDFKNPSFPDTLAGRLRAQIDQTRLGGRDMVLTLAIHHDDTTGALGAAVEKALEQILPAERDRSSPRVSGAFVFDTFDYKPVSPTGAWLTLWCPARLPFAFDGGLPFKLDGGFDDLDNIPVTALRTCALAPDLPDLVLGPFKFGTLPILPSRPQYLKFIEKYSAGQAGRVIDLTFLAPERTPISQNIRAGEFGVLTYFNNETFSALPTDTFSFCPSPSPPDPRLRYVVFRTLNLPAGLPLSNLPQFHQDYGSKLPQVTYELGLLWDFPFLTRMEYEFTVGGAVTAFSATVPFGVSSVTDKYHGNALWLPGPRSDGGTGGDAGTPAGVFPLDQTLKQCTRFCNHPTFNGSSGARGGVYEPQILFSPGYQTGCYNPRFPTPADGDFPIDP